MRDAQRKIDCEYYTVKPVADFSGSAQVTGVTEPACTLPGSPNSTLIRNTRRTFEENCARCEYNNWQNP